MHRNRYLFPCPMDLPETICNPFHIRYLFVRAAYGRSHCYTVIEKMMKVDHVYRVELIARPLPQN